MDASGKPQISRELLQRMTQSPAAPGSARRVGAYGATMHQVNRSRYNADRRRIGTYSSSNIANSALNTPLTDDSDSVETDSVETTELYGQNRQPGSSRLASSGGNSSKTGQSRQGFNSAPKITFKEPPVRNYNPFG